MTSDARGRKRSPAAVFASTLWQHPAANREVDTLLRVYTECGVDMVEADPTIFRLVYWKCYR